MSHYLLIISHLNNGIKFSISPTPHLQRGGDNELDQAAILINRFDGAARGLVIKN